MSSLPPLDSTVPPRLDTSAIYSLNRPCPELWKLYLIRAILSGPFIVFTLPFFYFRYKTLHYRFDDEGIHMRVGILFRREVNLTYTRIQDIHLRSGFIQRWLGLADLQIQTASGNAGAELVVEGFKEFESIRDHLYSKMRGARREGTSTPTGTAPSPAAASADPTVELLLEIRDELRRTREQLEGSCETQLPDSGDV